MSTDDDVLHLPGVHSELAAVRVLLANAEITAPHTGEPLSEDLLYGLSGGLATGAMTMRCETADVSTLWLTGWNPFGNSVVEACRRLGVRTSVRESTDAQEAGEHLAELLGRGSPVMAWVDEATLGHTGLPSRYVGTSYHAVAVYHSDAGGTLIGDRSPTRYIVDTSRFAASRECIAKDRHRLMSLDASSTDNPPPDIAAAVRTALDGWVDAVPTTGLTGTFSLEALGAIAAQIHGATGTETWDHIFPPGVDLWEALADLYRCVEWWGSGGGLMRPRFAGFLAEAAVLLEHDTLLDVAETYRDLGTEWTALASGPLVSHPLLARTREAVDASVRPVIEGADDAGMTAARAWSDLAALRTEVRTEGFPLTPAEIDALLSSLQSQLQAVITQEQKARSAVMAALPKTD